jgi:hypothetical protein
LQLSPHEMEGLMRSLNGHKGHKKIWSSTKRRPVRVNVTLHKVIVGGREIAGLARGPAYQGVRVGRIIQIYPVCFKPGFSGDEVCDSG